MVHEFFSNLKNESGVTLIEIVVVVFIITLFSFIVLADFPKIQRQYALSSATYALAQNIRRVEDLGLSGIQFVDAYNIPILAKGYGIYVNLDQSDKEYVVYADVNGDHYFDGQTSPYLLCDQVDQQSPNPQLTEDCVKEIIDVSKQNPALYIKSFENIVGNSASVNFRPPSPIVDISTRIDTGNPAVGITLGLNTDTQTRTVQVNASGLINVK